MHEREYDVALYGATGFTGGLAAAYLAEQGARWCIAGRSKAKLEALRGELGVEVPIEIASSDDPASLAALAAKTRVLATTVGPYAKYGMPVVTAAVDAGTDYVDITGEPAFVNDSRATLHDRARDKGLRIVHCCGFDSLPHDLGAWYTVQQLPPDADLTVDAFVSTRGGISGGTWNSALEAMGSQGLKPPPRTRSSGEHPSRIRQRFHRSKVAGGWAVPMPTIDPVIVVRSGRALGYGSAFSYGHYARVKTLRYLIGGGLAVSAVALASQVGPLRRLLQRQWPSGNGPDQQTRENGWFKILFIGSGGGKEVITECRGNMDPGYGLTSKWIAESALCLALDRDRLPERYGVLTPVAAMAEPLMDRMERTGTTFTTVS